MFPFWAGATSEEVKNHIATKTTEASLYAPVFNAIAWAESQFNPQAVNWNCYYGGKSKPCKKQDRDKAWSVDCGLYQINYKGNKCPSELFDIDINLARAEDLYFQRGYSPWSASFKVWITYRDDT